MKTPTLLLTYWTSLLTSHVELSAEGAGYLAQWWPGMNDKVADNVYARIGMCPINSVVGEQCVHLMHAAIAAYTAHGRRNQDFIDRCFSTMDTLYYG